MGFDLIERQETSISGGGDSTDICSDRDVHNVYVEILGHDSKQQAKVG